MTNKKKILLVLGIIIVVGLIWIGWYKFIRTNVVSTLPSNVATKPAPNSNKLNNERKKSTSPAPTLNNGPSNTSQGNSSSQSNSSKSPSFSVTITRVGIVNNNLQVGTIVNGTNVGTCTLKVSQTGQTTVTMTNQVMLQNNSYVCPVFNIPVSQFPNQGDWNILVQLSSNSNTVIANWSNNPINLSGTY
jgi:cytoskeletal protein RodZ